MKRKIFSILFAVVLLVSFSLVTAVPAAAQDGIVPDRATVITDAADRLVALQSLGTGGTDWDNDAGWDIEVYTKTSHSESRSELGIYGATGLGLIAAYRLTSDEAYLAAAKKVADYPLIVTNILTFDRRFMLELSEISRDQSYAESALASWPGAVSFFEGKGSCYDFYRGQWGSYVGAAFWETSEWALEAYLLEDEAWAREAIGLMLTDIALVTGADVTRFVGWGSLLRLLQTVDPVEYAAEIADLVEKLESGQDPAGYWMGPNHRAQDTAWAIMGLTAVDSESPSARKGAAWLVANQGYGGISGGWLDEEGDHKECPEYNSEAIQALVATPAPVSIGEKGYYTIQDAIDAASSGDAINVAAGIYEENVVIDKMLTLQGENRHTTEIKFGYGGHPSEPPLTISADEVTVSGFTIRSGPDIEPAWTIVVEGDSALLTDLHVIKDPCFWPNGSPKHEGSAFLLTPGLDSFKFTHSVVDSAWNGIYAPGAGSSNIVVRKVDFTYPGDCGILLIMVTGATIEENTFTCTGHSISGKVSEGIKITRGSNGIEIRGNQFIGSQPLDVSHTGIFLINYKTGTMGVTILGNGISGFNTGILVEDVAPESTIDIKGNTITENGIGIFHPSEDEFLFDSSLTIQDNTISGNYGGGVVLGLELEPPIAELSSVTIKGNAITNNGSLGEDSGGGIAFAGTFSMSSLTIEDNFISGNLGTMPPEPPKPPTGGVMVGGFFDGSSLTITGNTIGAGTGPEGSPYSGNAPLGIFVGGVELGSSADIHFNNIAGNIYGLAYGDGMEPVNATLNWWGTTSEDAIEAMISEVGVIYTPWLPTPIDKIEDGAWQSVFGSNPEEVDLTDTDGNTIAKVDISGGPGPGTITATRYSTEPEPQGTSLSLGTGETGVVFVDILVTGYIDGTAHITVPYADANNDGWVDDIVPAMDENTLGLWYWDMGMWRLADNSAVDADANTVSGDIPVAALQGTPIGLGGNTTEAIVAIDSISYLSDESEDTISLTINTGTAFLGAATIDLTFDNTVVDVLGYEDGDFDALEVNLEYQFDGNLQTARFVAYQMGADGVDATGGAVLAQVKLKAAGAVLSSCSLTVGVVTLTDNEGNDVDYFTIEGTATCSGVGDADLSYKVDVFDCVYIARAIAGFPPTDLLEYIINPAVMNVDGSDEPPFVDAYDCTYLARHIAGFADEYPLPVPPVPGG